ncbi:MAG: translocation/assembly module TamB domain-containing protein, partial [Archangium sp.]|nr:translocation/assembly module TamB domain-containing protein [Archangium sp.]
MQSSRRRWRIVLGAVALLLIAGALALRTDRAGEAVCEQLRERLPKATGMKVELGKCSIDPLTASVEISRIAVTPPPAPEPLLTADRAAVSLRGLFLGGLSLQDVELIRPHLELSLDAPSGTKAAGCPVDELKKLRIARLKVVDGSVVVHRPAPPLAPGAKKEDQQPSISARIDALQIDASLDRREASLVLDARGGSVSIDSRTLRLGKIAVEGALDLEAAQVELVRGEASVEGVTASVSGAIDALCDDAPTLDLSAQAWVPMDALTRIGIPLPAPSGQVLARVTVGGKATEPTVRGEVRGSKVVIGPFTPGDFSARAAWNGKRVSLEEFSTRVGEGDVKVVGELSLEGNFPVTARIDAKEASLGVALARASVKGAWVDFPASVSGVVKGNLLPSPVLGGDLELRAGNFKLATRAFDGPQNVGTEILAFKSAAGRFHFGVTAQAVSFDDVAIRVGAEERTRISGRVKLLISNPGAPGIDLAVSADAVNLADFVSPNAVIPAVGQIAEMPWAGEGSARVNITGPLSKIVVDGQTTLRDFKLRGYSLGVVQTPVHYSGDTLSFPSVVAQKGQTQYFADVALSFKETGLLARATAQLPDGRVEDVVDLLADLSPSIQNLQDRALVGRLGALIAIESPVTALEGVILARVRDVKYLDRGLGEADVVARFDKGEALVLDPTIFTGTVGKLAASGRWGFAGPLDFSLAVEHGSLQELIDPDREIPATGEFVAKAKIGGTTDEMRINGWISSSLVSWKEKPLGPLHLEAKTVARDAEITGTAFPGLQVQLQLAMKNEWPFRLQSQVSFNDLSPFLPESAAGVAVKLKGAVAAEGPMKTCAQRNAGGTCVNYAMGLSEVRAQAALDEVSIARGEVAASNTETVRLAWNAGAIVVDSLELKGPTTQLTAAGAWGPSTVDLKTRGSIDLRLLGTLVSSLERTAGKLDFTAAFSGPVKEPVLAGTASLIDTRFGVRGQDLAVRSLSGRADFSGSRILIQDVQGFLNDGRIRARGDARLQEFSLNSIRLQTDVEDVTVQVQPDVPVTLTGSLLLSSADAEKFQLQGGLDVVKFRYTQPMALESLVASAKQPPASSDAKPNEWLRLDVNLDASSGDVRIENDLARARLAGKLKLSGTNVKPVLIGVIETQEGAQAFFRGNTYNVQRGQLQFNGLWPTFDLSAQSQIREYLVTVKAFGRFEDPKVSLSSEPMLPDADVLSLVTLGVTSRERISDRSAGGIAAEALYSASGLDQQVQRFLQQSVG